jgi:hypothetical protein
VNLGADYASTAPVDLGHGPRAAIEKAEEERRGFERSAPQQHEKQTARIASSIESGSGGPLPTLDQVPGVGV